MHLYTYDPAPNPRRIGLLLQYKGVQIPTTQVDLKELAQFSAEYREVNPDSTVPALVVEDHVLTETIAIALYIDSHFPDKPVFGKNELEKAQIIGWCHRLFTWPYSSVAEMLRNRSRAFENRALPGSVDLAQIPELVERGQQRLRAFWPELEQHLEGRDYMVGDCVSQADIDLLALCGFIAWVKESVPDDCTNIHAWKARMEKEILGH